jgi:hypothetical protein
MELQILIESKFLKSKMTFENKVIAKTRNYGTYEQIHQNILNTKAWMDW